MTIEEDFDDNDSDRDSNYEVGDVEADDDDDDRDTEDVPDVADTGHTAATASDSDSDAKASVASTRQWSASSSYVWETVANDYVPRDDLPYTDTPGVASSITLTADSLLVEFVHLLFTDEIINKCFTQTNRYEEQFLNRIRTESH